MCVFNFNTDKDGARQRMWVCPAVYVCAPNSRQKFPISQGMSGLKLMAKIPHLSRYVRPQTNGQIPHLSRYIRPLTNGQNSPSLRNVRPHTNGQNSPSLKVCQASH